MSLDRIPVATIEPATGMAEALMGEIAGHLTTLATTGQSHVIDLTSLPLNKSDLSDLGNYLGRGEIHIQLSTIGDTEIFETAYSGIWWLKHYAPDGRLLSELLEICYIPDIVKAQTCDIKTAARQLSVQLENKEELITHSSA